MVRLMPTTGRFLPAAWLIGTLTLGSRVLGLARECLFSYYFSTSELLSAFRIAFMAPNLARRLFGEGALASAMIPVLTDTLQAHGEEQSRRFVGALLTALAVVLGVILLAVEGGIGVWRALRDDLALELAAVLMPYMLLVCLVAVAGAVLNVRRHFAVPAAAPMVLNLGIIGAILGGSIGAGLTKIPLMYAVCAGVLAAGVGQIALSGLALKAVSFFPIFGIAWRDPQVRAVARLMGPMILGLSAVQINSLVDYLIAYLFIEEGGERVGPAVLGYAQYLYQLPLGVFGIAIATAVFPALSRHAAEGDRRGLADTFVQASRLSLFIALPASVGLMFVAGPLVATLYQRGQFDAADTRRVAATLLFYSIGLAAYFLQHIVVRTWYALHDSRVPARVALAMVVVNFAMNLALVFVLEERGLALATAVCALIQVAWLSVRLGRRVPEIAWRRLGTGAVQMLTATALMGVALAILVSPALAGRWLPTMSAARLVTLLVAGVIVYAMGAHVLRIEEWRDAVRRARRSREKTE